MMGGNMGKMMKQLQKMQADLQRLQQEAGNRTVEATAGGGMVKVLVTGNKELKEIHLAPEVVDPDDVEMLQDLILAAVNEGLKQADQMMASEMAKVTGGMKLPGM